MKQFQVVVHKIWQQIVQILILKGVFYLPKEMFYCSDYVPQVSNKTNDIVYYELGRFVELLCASNPNILELLNAPEHVVIYRHPLFMQFNPEWFLSKGMRTDFCALCSRANKKSARVK